LREVHQKNLTPNPFPPLPSPLLKGEGKGIMFLAGRGVKIKASLLVGERFGERSECTASNREGLYKVTVEAAECGYSPASTK